LIMIHQNAIVTTYYMFMHLASLLSFLRAVFVRGNLSLAPTKSKQAPTTERSLDNQRQTGTAVVLGGHIPPPMRQP
jgi:hypothetical protein